MADNFSDWYMGSMAPPLRLPGGGYAPAPSVSAPASIDDIYRGIYGPSGAPALTSVSRPTVPVNPQTGMPYMTTASAKGGAGVGHGYAASGSATYAAPRQFQANPLPGIRDLGAPQYGVPGSGGGVLTKSGLPPGATVEKTYTAPLVPKPLVAGSARGSASLGAGSFGSGSLSIPRLSSPKTGDDVIDLSALEMSDRGAQNTADSEGKPVRVKGGKVYYPGGRGPVAASGGGAPRAASVAPARSGGLFGGLFGGGNSGGLFGGLMGGSSAPRTQAVAQLTSGPAIYTPSGNVHPGSFYDNSGNDMAFMPQSYQDNPRNSNGGY